MTLVAFTAAMPAAAPDPTVREAWNAIIDGALDAWGVRGVASRYNDDVLTTAESLLHELTNHEDEELAGDADEMWQELMAYRARLLPDYDD
jgi:hypothetical protein